MSQIIMFYLSYLPIEKFKKLKNRVDKKIVKNV